MGQLLHDTALRSVFAIDRLLELFDAARSQRDGDPIANLLALLDVTFECDPEELERIPRQGPLLIAANHPFGLLEGAILAAELPKVRPDIRILTNSLLAPVP